MEAPAIVQEVTTDREVMPSKKAILRHLRYGKDTAKDFWVGW